MIKFYIPGYTNDKPKRASYRFRALIPLQGMRPGDGVISNVQQSVAGDIVILAKKSKPEDLEYLKQHNIKTVYDICDNKWRKYVSKSWADKIIIPHNFLCRESDLITTTCLNMKYLIQKETGKDSIVINDPYEAVKKEPNVDFNKPIINIFTFGNSKHFSRVHWNVLIKKLRDTDINFQITAMTDRSNKFKEIYKEDIEKGKLVLYEYDDKKQYELMNNADIVFLPIVTTSADTIKDMKAKSPNRIMDAIMSGKPVVSNIGVDSWMPFVPFSDFSNNETDELWIQNFKALINRTKEETNNKIKQGQYYIEQNHSPSIIGKKWIELERL